MTTFYFHDFDEAYKTLIRAVINFPNHKVMTRGREVYEIEDAIFHVDWPEDKPIETFDPERNLVIDSYTKREFQLYASLKNDAKTFEEASKFWGKLQNPDGTVNSAYGWLIWRDHSYGNPEFEKTRGEGQGNVVRTPWEWCVEALKRDKHTRHATLKFAKRQHFWFGNKDVTCTLHAQFSIRDNRLNMSVVMRASDLVLGIVYDLPFFAHLQKVMVGELITTYPELAVGSYTHHSHSLHIYKDDLDKARKMAGLGPVKEVG